MGALNPDMSMQDFTQMAEHTYIRETTNEMSHSNSKCNAIYTKHAGQRYGIETGDPAHNDMERNIFDDTQHEELNRLYNQGIKNLENLQMLQESIVQSNQVSASHRGGQSFMAPIIMRTGNNSNDFQEYITPNNPLATYIPPNN